MIKKPISIALDTPRPTRVAVALAALVLAIYLATFLAIFSAVRAALVGAVVRRGVPIYATICSSN